MAYQRTDLHLAVINGFLGTVKRLVEEGANVNAMDIYGKTPLILAVESYNDEVDKLNDNVIPAKDAKKTVIHDIGANENNTEPFSASIAFQEIAKILIENGADVNMVDSFNKTALFYAINGICRRYGENKERKLCHISSSSFPQLLLNNGADPSIGLSVLKVTSFPCKQDHIHKTLYQTLTEQDLNARRYREMINLLFKCTVFLLAYWIIINVPTLKDHPVLIGAFLIFLLNAFPIK